MREGVSDGVREGGREGGWNGRRQGSEGRRGVNTDHEIK